MLANGVTLGRVFLVLGALLLLKASPQVALALLVLSFVLDAADGWIARALGTANIVGGLLDVAADRFTELVCWVYFAMLGLVPFWVPVLVLARGFATDLIRTAGARLGLSMAGDRPALASRLGRLLIGSKVSRGGYAALKTVTFVALGYLAAQPAAAVRDGSVVALVRTAAPILVTATVTMCLLRAIPVLIEARRVFHELSESGGQHKASSRI